jgi:hypothetical protein
MMEQESLVLGITLVILAIIICRVCCPWMFSELIEITADDGHKYLVMNLKDKKEAANKLADIKGKLLRLIDDFQYELLSKESKEDIQRMKHKFKAILSENAPGGRYTSYTVNKGEHIYMCIREREDNNTLIDDNILMFVALHELAHVMTKSIGHQRDFKENFRMLLKLAQKRGYYKYHPYHIKPQKYCGTRITTLP